MIKKGFTLIELVIAIGLSALFIPALVYVYSFSLGSAGQGENYTKAYTLAQETMEAIFYLKENDGDWDWETEPENTGVDEYYQPEFIGNEWSLGVKTTNPEETDEGYTVTVEIFDREDGVEHNKSRKVVVNVLWEEKGQPTSIDLVSFITKH